VSVKKETLADPRLLRLVGRGRAHGPATSWADVCVLAEYGHARVRGQMKGGVAEADGLAQNWRINPRRRRPIASRFGCFNDQRQESVAQLPPEKPRGFPAFEAAGLRRQPEK